MTENLRELVAVNLRYDPGAAALRTRAISQIVLKTMFAAGKKVSMPVGDIRKSAGKALDIKALREDSVLEALEHLDGIGLATESSKGRWLLTDHGFAEVASDVDRAASRVAGVLDRHFPARLDCDKLREWFGDACVEFYRLFGSEWAAALARKRSPARVTRDSLANVLSSTVQKHKLDDEREVLFDGFHSFITSTAPEDNEHSWTLGQAMLAAQLVAANIGIDPLSSTDLRDCLLLLDTNALIVTVLEAHRLAAHLEELGQSLAKIGVQVGVIPATRAEYEALIRHKREVGIVAASKYSPVVLKDSSDQFLQTALGRHCARIEDFERFFDEIRVVPNELADNVQIRDISDDLVRQLSERGAKDERLVREISEAWASRRRRRKKSPAAAIHDAVLTTVVEGLRSRGRKAAIVTLD